MQMVYDLILQRVASQAWASGSRCPSVRELAGDLKVSSPSVHAAIRVAVRAHLLEVHPRRQAIVLPGADKRAMRLLADSNTAAKRRNVALLIPEEFFPLSGAPFQSKLAKAVTKAAGRQGWHCRQVRIPAQGQSKLARKVVRHFDAAFVIDPLPTKLAVLFTLAEHGFPMLSYNRRVPGIDMPVLTTDDYGASRQLGRLLASHGHTNICFVATPTHAYLDGPHSAVSGWTDLLNEMGLMNACTLPVFYYKTSPLISVMLQRLFSVQPRITGLVFDVPPDLSHIGSDPWFRDLRIPEDFSVAAMSSMAGVPWPSHHPPVTSFEVDWDRAG
ncbi:MAG: GntR family transcriptional regulator, partial [Planctomycetes bacterium]|nr:GntR family transcriptional regulator [Planctomycetota bacterium]